MARTSMFIGVCKNKEDEVLRSLKDWNTYFEGVLGAIPDSTGSNT